MNGTRPGAVALAASAIAAARASPEVEVALFPPFPYLSVVAEALGSPGGLVALGGQGCHWVAKGPHTSGVAASMLVEVGCSYVLCGHSEVRRELGYDDARVRGAVEAALEAGLRPILCVGETQTERDAGRAQEVLARQVNAVVAGRTDVANGIDVAYEPVWAIGTGLNATPAQAAEAHGWIRERLRITPPPSEGGARRVRILYGGSVAPPNIEGFLSQPGIDGVLVGGMSLDGSAFTALVEAARAAAVLRRRS